MEPSELRVGDTEREDALRALGDHMAAGRIDLDEYGDRSAKVTVAKTRGELLSLFSDLPAPKPAFGPALPPPPTQATPAPLPAPVPRTAVNAWQSRPLNQRIFAALVPLGAITGVILAITLHLWPLLLLPVAIGAIGGALFGDDWRNEMHRNRHRGHGHRRDYRRGHYGRGWH
ncbi:DUF1707 SHOCT-like domain-containing protein [Actinokineospora enzanensis]|uniref:DUF1707 SHOCT-like domain-containing protein n=1 Tax=Actinokineospora enzanensis TaxID=155975 RepID=UPI00035E7FD8|nr:DUF1707 domain-containing protein [Actinokineospora enzanensis]